MLCMASSQGRKLRDCPICQSKSTIITCDRTLRLSRLGTVWHYHRQKNGENVQLWTLLFTFTFFIHLSLGRLGGWSTTDHFTIIFLCSPLPFGTWWTLGLSIPWCCLPTSFSVRLFFFPLSLCLARWFWPNLMNGRHDHTTSVCISLRWSGCLHVVQLPAGSWHRFPH